LRRPHGLDFIDDTRIVVANREGQACIFEVPMTAMGACELEPFAVFNSNIISSPGSVAVTENKKGLYEALICNDYANEVTKHSIDLREGCSVNNDTVFLKKWIHFPDGVCVSKERKWIAVSNHHTHAIFLYKNDPSLKASSTPDGILRHYYPHGLRFASDDRLVIAASAATPYVNIYQAPDSDWRGVRSPAVSIKVLSNEDYLRCRISREDGGPKGIDINGATDLMVMTCENQPLAFFDLGSILEDVRLNSKSAPPNLGKKIALSSNYPLLDSGQRVRKGLEIKYHLYLGQTTAALTAAIRWVLRKLPALSWVLNKGRKIWNPQFLTKPF